jgi:hypothetical protein
VKKKVHANHKQPGGGKEEKTALFLLSHSLCRKAKERDEKKNSAAGSFPFQFGI